MKKRFIALLLSAFLLLPFFGCKAKPAAPDSLIGTWKDTYGLTEYQFESGGKMKFHALKLGSFNGTYQVSGDRITVRYRVLVKEINDTYRLKIDGDTLYLDNNEFKRKK